LFLQTAAAASGNFGCHQNGRNPPTVNKAESQASRYVRSLLDPFLLYFKSQLTLETVMKSVAILFATASAFIAINAQSAYAEDTWTKTVTFTRSDASAIKVTEPEGYRASITVGDATSGDILPTAFLNIPNAEAFYTVTFTAPGGATWKTKVETKKFFVTELRAKHVAAAPTAAPTSKQKFFGKLRPSKQKESVCGYQKDYTKVEFVDSSGSVAASVNFKGKVLSFDIPAGEYQIRTFRVDPGAEPLYRNTRKGTVTADGWQAAVFCDPAGTGAAVEFYTE
jgi:hypothetical protein